MSDIAELNQERPAERLSRRQRADRLTSGARSPVDYLTDAERELLACLRAEHFDVQHGWLVVRDGSLYRHSRVVVKAARSWYSSIDRT